MSISDTGHDQMREPSREMKKQKKHLSRRLTWAWLKRKIIRLLGYLALIFVVVAMSFPILWMILSSFKTEGEVLGYPPTFFPQEFTLESYRLLLETDFRIWFRNSLIVASIATTVAVGISAIGAYALVRSRNRPIRTFSGLVLFTYMVPSILLLIPIFRLVVNVQLANSLTGIIVVYIAILLPFGLWTLRSYFAGIPHEIEEAALIDGATHFQAFYKVVLPQALPGLIAVALFAFNVAWQEYLFASILVGSGSKWTLSPGIANLIGAFGDQSWSMVMAASTLATIPVIIIFTLLQSYLIAGWGGGAVKG